MVALIFCGNELGQPAGAVVTAVEYPDDEFVYREAAQEAIDRYGTPESVNTDQRSQFTSLEFNQLLKDLRGQHPMALP